MPQAIVAAKTAATGPIALAVNEADHAADILSLAVDARVQRSLAAIAPGQTAVLYDDTRVIGSATITATRENSRYLPGMRLPDSVLATTDHVEALRDASLVIVAVPSHFVRAALAPMVRCCAPIMMASCVAKILLFI